jgi:hypothetical protein
MFSWVNTPERIIQKSKPLLEPGEVVAHVVRAQEGPNKWLGLSAAVALGLTLGLVIPPALGIPVFYLTYTSLYRRRILLATDQALVVVAGRGLRYTPSAVLDRLDMETRMGPTKGLWMQVEVGGRRLWIVPRTVPELQAADAELDT